MGFVGFDVGSRSFKNEIIIPLLFLIKVNFMLLNIVRLLGINIEFGKQVNIIFLGGNLVNCDSILIYLNVYKIE